MPSRDQLLREHARRISAAKLRGDHHAVELHTAAWHRLHRLREGSLDLSGLARRMAARRAATPLDQRLIGPTV